MLEVEKKKTIVKATEEMKKNKKPEDIIITKFEKKIEYKNGEQIIKRIPIKVNLTKKINETKKLIKNYSAEEKLNELEKIFTK